MLLPLEPKPHPRVSLISVLPRVFKYVPVVAVVCGGLIGLGAASMSLVYTFLGVPLVFLTQAQLLRAGLGTILTFLGLAAMIGIPCSGSLAMGFVALSIRRRLRGQAFLPGVELRVARPALKTIGWMTVVPLLLLAAIAFPISPLAPALGGWPFDVTLTGPASVLSQGRTRALPRSRCSGEGSDVTCTDVLLVSRDERELLVMDRDLNWVILGANQVQIERGRVGKPEKQSTRGETTHLGTMAPSALPTAVSGE